MESNRQEQLEAVKVLAGFQEKFIANTEILVKELTTEKKDDTDKLLKSVIDSLNWEIGVLGGTLSLINEKEEKLNKDDINAAVMKLSEALRGKDDKEIAEALESHLLPVLKKVLSAVKEMDLSDCDGQGF